MNSNFLFHDPHKRDIKKLACVYAKKLIDHWDSSSERQRYYSKIQETEACHQFDFSFFELFMREFDSQTDDLVKILKLKQPWTNELDVMLKKYQAIPVILAEIREEVIACEERLISQALP